MARAQSPTRKRAIKVWNEVLQVGEEITSTELADTLDLRGAKNRSCITGILVQLWKKGCAERTKADRDGVRGRSRYRFTKLADYAPWKPPEVVEPSTGEEESLWRVCIKCNNMFTPTALGESVLKIVEAQAGFIKRLDKQGVEKGEEFRALVKEKTALEQHIDNQAQLINELNNKLTKATGKTFDLHALADFRSHLPNEGEGKNAKAATGN